MPDTTQKTSSGFSWSDIVNAALTIYGLGKGSGSTPNTYPVPLTPGEEWVQGGKKSLFDYSSAFNDQYMRGLGDMNPKWAPSSPLLGAGGSGGFMGGVHVPVIDWSKMPQRPSSGGGGAPTPPGGTSGGAPTNGVAGDPFGHLSAPAGSQGDAFGGWPAPSPTAHNVTWDDIKKYGPIAFKLASGLAATGMGLYDIWTQIRAAFGDNPNAIGPQDTQETLGSKGMTPDQFTPTYPRTATQPLAGAFINSNINNLGSDPGQFAPEHSGLGGGQGFGYGLGYDQFHGSGGRMGGPRGNAPVNLP